jgi:Uma2 family endonuclease
LRRISFEEYLAQEEKAQVRHELLDGLLYAMAGTTLLHNRICRNLVVRLQQKVRGSGCEVFFADVKLRVDFQTAYYPDILVCCQPESHEQYVEHPCLVIEVLSRSTETVDRREKLAKYRQIPSLRAYVLVDSLSRRLEAYYREGKNWLYLDVVGEGNLPIPCPEMSLNLDEVYEGLDVPVERPNDEA